ncbi:binding partner of ACD11 1-like [Typha angustifolia]|uniref:binding partner of ACD11 1-like n=1 Tax=Typha angustifolia TaxID=59011 RepID=UPI003C2C03B2
MSAKTVKVTNVSLQASQQDVKEFFSFSGDIQYIEMQSEDELSQVAYITFKEIQGAETAMLLSGATIVDMPVVILPAIDYQLPAAALAPPTAKDSKPVGAAESAVQKAEDIVSAMLAKGFILGKDALNKAKALDEKHQFTSTATAKVSSLDKTIGFSEKISMGTSAVNEKVKEMDQKFQVSEKTKSAIAAAEQKVTTAGSAIMSNRYVLTGAAWVTGAFNKVATAASDVGSKAKEKLVSEQEQEMERDFTQVHISENPDAAPAELPNNEPAQVHVSETPYATSAEHLNKEPAEHPNKPESFHGLIL